jgi:perosamine synthetase
MTIQDRVRQFILESFYVSDPAELTDELSLLDSGYVDSTGMTEIILFLEREYAIHIEDYETIPENLESISQIAAFVARKQSAVASSPRPVGRAIPLARPDTGARELELVTLVLQSDVLALGSFAERFEAGIAAVAARREGVACSSGTAGLHLGVRALEIGEGDEVITTPFSFIASSNCLLYERAVPRFVDIEEDSLGIDPDLMEDAATRRTRAILPVHVFGRPCKIEAVEAVARQRGWAIIEDACEGLGSSVGGRPLGSFGDVAVFAFYPNKQITTGEGGMVVTDDAALADTMRSLRNQGRDADGTWLRHVRLAYNYRLDELSAALGVARLERLEELRRGRARVAAGYERALGRRDWVTLPRAGAGEIVDWFIYAIRLHREIDRDRIVGRLAELGVPTRPYFAPIHLQPFYRTTFGFRPGDFPITERVAASTLALPFSSRLSDEDVRYAADALSEAVDAETRA